ncbi:MAG: hypothetical protein ACREJU_01625 [Nitrospiraceae bacterium]
MKGLAVLVLLVTYIVLTGVMILREGRREGKSRMVAQNGKEETS